MNINALKRTAAEKAVERVESGMIIGLGSGSTASYAIIKIGRLLQAGKLTNIVGVPTSEATAKQARACNIPLANLDEHHQLDLAIDGADEVDPHLNLVKGLGGALLREKMVEMTAQHFVVVVDESKLVDKLGTRGPLPIEVTQFGWKTHARWLESLGCTPSLRGGESDPFVTDNCNFILDCTFPEGIDDPAELAASLTGRVGLVEHGLFLEMSHEVIVAGSTGVRVLTK